MDPARTSVVGGYGISQRFRATEGVAGSYAGKRMQVLRHRGGWRSTGIAPASLRGRRLFAKRRAAYAGVSQAFTDHVRKIGDRDLRVRQIRMPEFLPLETVGPFIAN